MSKRFGSRNARVNTNPLLPSAKKGKGIHIKRDYYTMASTDGTDAEITMYGEIVMEQPTDWWGDPIEGMYISLDEFLEDLKQIANAKNITIRMNSVGGDAYASITIHNRLKELKANITCIVDGVAMSGGSLIICAADTVKVNPSSLIMIHKCWSFIWGAYNGDELHKIAESNDAVDKAQAAIYKQKTGMTEEEILELMRDETYMTGEEAVEKGFADEVIEGEKPDIAASADRKQLFVNGRMLHLFGSKLPDNIPIVTTTKATAKVAEINKNLPETSGGEGGNEPMAKNIDELRAEYPELTAQLENEAKAAVSQAINDAIETERKRQQEIDEIAPAVNDADLVREAKYGPNTCTAQELAFKAMQKQSKQGSDFLTSMDTDYQASNASNVGATPNGGEENPQAKLEADVDAGVEAVKKAKSGGK